MPIVVTFSSTTYQDTETIESGWFNRESHWKGFSGCIDCYKGKAKSQQD